MLSAPEETLHLSPRRLETIRLLAEGLTAKEIGLQMGISYRTVEAHISQVRKQLHFRSSHRKLVVWAREFIENAPQSREDRIKAASAEYRLRIEAITDGPQWRHPNLAAVADRLRRIEDDLLAWSRNQEIETPRKTATEAPEETEHSGMEANGEPT